MKKLFFILILIKGFWNELLLPFIFKNNIVYFMYEINSRKKNISIIMMCYKNVFNFEE